jgi:Fic family protein
MSARIEPCLFEDEFPRVLADLAVEIQRASITVGNGLNQDSLAELANLVQMMNSHYSNLIEGHSTSPLDIEKVLTGVQIEPEKRSLALEAKAHVEVQRAIDVAHMSHI